MNEYECEFCKAEMAEEEYKTIEKFFKDFHFENVFFDILPLTINKGIFLSLI